MLTRIAAVVSAMILAAGTMAADKPAAAARQEMEARNAGTETTVVVQAPAEEKEAQNVSYKPAVNEVYIEEAAPTRTLPGTTKPAVEHRLSREAK